MSVAIFGGLLLVAYALNPSKIDEVMLLVSEHPIFIILFMTYLIMNTGGSSFSIKKGERK